MNGDCLNARERVLGAQIDLSRRPNMRVTNTSLCSIDINPLSSNIIREIFRVFASAKNFEPVFRSIFPKYPFANRDAISPRIFASGLPIARNYFSLFGKTESISTRRYSRWCPPAHSCTVTDVDDLSLSSSVISVGRTRWHLAVKNISSADVPARAFCSVSPPGGGEARL